MKPSPTPRKSSPSLWARRIAIGSILAIIIAFYLPLPIEIKVGVFWGIYTAQTVFSLTTVTLPLFGHVLTRFNLLPAHQYLTSKTPPAQKPSFSVQGILVYGQIVQSLVVGIAIYNIHDTNQHTIVTLAFSITVISMLHVVIWSIFEGEISHA